MQPCRSGGSVFEQKCMLCDMIVTFFFSFKIRTVFQPNTLLQAARKETLPKK